MLSCYMREACTALDLSSQAVLQASSFRQQVFSVQNDVKNAWQPKNGFLVSVDSHAHVATCDCAGETLFPTDESMDGRREEGDLVCFPDTRSDRASGWRIRR